MERAITQQPADRGGINVVGASDISLRLAPGQALQRFLPLMRCHLARSSEPHAPFLLFGPIRIILDQPKVPPDLPLAERADEGLQESGSTKSARLQHARLSAPTCTRSLGVGAGGDRMRQPLLSCELRNPDWHESAFPVKQHFRKFLRLLT
jgi:hypothetical protein